MYITAIYEVMHDTEENNFRPEHPILKIVNPEGIEFVRPMGLFSLTNLDHIKSRP